MMHSTQRVSLTARISVAICLVTAAAIGVPPSAWSAGIMLYEQGTPDVGLASAGQGARAQDAGTVFTNPAGMTQLKDSQLLGRNRAELWQFHLQPQRQDEPSRAPMAATPRCRCLAEASFTFTASLRT